MANAETREPFASDGQTGNCVKSSRALWLEVLAVLTIAVIPNISMAVILLNFPSKPSGPYWMSALDEIIVNACVSFAVLYLIGRSGVAWSTFGLKTPQVIDICVGLVVFFVSLLSWRIERLFPSSGSMIVRDFFARPVDATDYVLMIPSIAASAFQQELVVRAYMITRLEQLMQSRTRAVVLAALVFASYHIYNGAWGLVGPFLDGLFYGTLYLLVRRIWPFVIGHTLYNIFALLPIWR